MTTKRKPGRPKKPGGPAIKLSISIPPKTLEAIDRARGRMNRSKFLLTKAGYGGDNEQS